MNETILMALALIPALVIAIVFHEVAHGWAALMLGDRTAQERRRLTLNPIRHVDPVGTLILPGLLALAGLPVFGWAKPVPVNASRLRNPRFGMMAVAAAGPLTNFVLAALGALALGLYAGSLTVQPGAVGAYALIALQSFISINLFLGMFNLLPIPPFDGSHIVEGLLPDQAAGVYARMRPYGFVLLFTLLLVVPWLFPQAGIIERVVLPPVEWVHNWFMRLTMWVAVA